jgi:hypothetical protein
VEANGKKKVVEEVKEEARELAMLLDDFSGRLRRMRQRNRQVEQEIVDFEKELRRLRDDVLDAGN